MRRIASLISCLSMASACGGVAPTAPSASPATGLALTCSASTLLAGDLVVCKVSAASVDVSTTAIWTSSDPSIARSEGIGFFVGKSAGQTTLSATYSGRTLSAPLTVLLQDVFRVTASAEQGSFKVGTSATLWLQGFYGVESADAGTLTLVVTNQDDAIISTSAPQTVPRGGDTYIISTTFTLPPDATRVCRTGFLQIGSKTLTAVPAASLVPCFAVTP
jgi:hypothetical protein